jgi:hypothetical protein
MLGCGRYLDGRCRSMESFAPDVRRWRGLSRAQVAGAEPGRRCRDTVMEHVVPLLVGSSCARVSLTVWFGSGPHVPNWTPPSPSTVAPGLRHVADHIEGV